MSGGDWKDMFGAACRGDVELVQFHLDHGADVNLISTADERTPLQAARQTGMSSVQERLQSRGAR